jgi:CHAT domain-containing protein
MNKFNLKYSLFLSGIICTSIFYAVPFSLNLDPTFAQSNQSSNQKSQADRQIKVAEDQIQVYGYPQAQLALENALRIYQSISDRQGQKLALVRLAQVSYRQAEYLKVEEYLRQAERLPNRELEGAILSLKGLIQLELGNYTQALQNLRAAQGRQATDLAAENRNRIGLGEAYHGIGAYTQALSLLEVAVKAPGDRFDRARSINALGDLNFSLGQYDLAESLYKQALQIRQSIGDRPGAGRTLRNLGRVSQALKKFPQALEYYLKAVEQMSGQRDFIGQAKLQNDVGMLEIERGNLLAAEGYLQEALATTRLSDGTGRAEILGNLGYLNLRKRSFDLAINYFSEALAWSKKQGDRTNEIKALSGLGEARLGLGQYKQAVEILQTAMESFEGIRPGLRDAEKISLFDTYSYVYRLLQKALVADNQTEQALVIAERGRARAFTELLAQKETKTLISNIQTPNISQIQAVARQEKATLVVYSVIYGSDRQESALYTWIIQPTGEISFRQIDLQKAIKTTLASIAKESRSGAAIGEDSPELSNFVVSMRGTITNQAKSLKRTNNPPTNSLSNSSSNPQTSLLSLQNAYQLLIQPIQTLLPKDAEARVIIVPQDSLFLVPFAALQDEKGKYLIQSYTLQISPSIQALTFSANAQRSNTNLVVGNPSPMPQKLDLLPGSEKEAQAIAKILQTQPLIGRNANKTNILKQISQASVIHFATHGLLNDREALQSALALSTSSGDGLLTAGEIFDLKLRATLAVLSACDTGRGKITGDGVVGLARSLTSAGVSSVIVSLWSVPDRPTSDLMISFYRHWQENPIKARALRKAMLEAIAKYPNPRDWAGFMLIGKEDFLAPSLAKDTQARNTNKA